MKKSSVTKIIIIISVIILTLGLITGIGIFNSTENSIQNESIYIDGTDFSGIGQIIGIIGSKIIGILIIIVTFIIDISIWLIYGIILLITSIVKKINKKKIIQIDENKTNIN